MTNIRIEVDHPLPAPGTFEDYGPDEVRDLLAGAGVLRRHPRVVFLSGYCGGQVNPATGDFVFNCKAIYDLSEAGVALFQPAIFSGSMFGALQSDPRGVRPAAARRARDVRQVGPERLRRAAAAIASSCSIRTPRSGSAEPREPRPPSRRPRHGAPAGRRRSGPGRLPPPSARRLSLGVKDRQAGGAHAPIDLAESCAARYLLVWADGAVSRGALERRQIEREPERALADARAAAYDDPDAAHVLGPAAVSRGRAPRRGGRGLARATRRTLGRASGRDPASGSTTPGFATWSGSFSCRRDHVAAS